MFQWAVYRAKEYHEALDPDNYLGEVIADTMEMALNVASRKSGLDAWSLWVFQGQEYDESSPIVEVTPAPSLLRRLLKVLHI